MVITPKTMGRILQRGDDGKITIVESEDTLLWMNHQSIVGVLRRSIGKFQLFLICHFTVASLFQLTSPTEQFFSALKQDFFFTGKVPSSYLNNISVSFCKKFK